MRACAGQSVPQRRKPRCMDCGYGTAEAMPLTMRGLIRGSNNAGLIRGSLSGFGDGLKTDNGKDNSRFPSGMTTRNGNGNKQRRRQRQGQLYGF